MGANVRTLREALGLSQEQLARKAKMQAPDVSRIESGQYGERGWGLMRVFRLARALKVEPARLFQS